MSVPEGRQADGYWRNRFNEPVDFDGFGPSGYRGQLGRPYLGPPVLAREEGMRGIECASESKQRLSDEVSPWNGCPHCGHRECYPGSPCGLCQLNVRMNRLEDHVTGRVDDTIVDAEIVEDSVETTGWQRVNLDFNNAPWMDGTDYQRQRERDWDTYHRDVARLADRLRNTTRRQYAWVTKQWLAELDDADEKRRT